MSFFEYIEFAASGESYKDWLLVFGVGLGFILALIVLVVGLLKKKKKWAIIGFFATFIGNSSIGLIVGLPVLLVFLWLIFKPQKDQLLDAEEDEEDLDDIELDDSDFEDGK